MEKGHIRHIRFARMALTTLSWCAVLRSKYADSGRFSCRACPLMLFGPGALQCSRGAGAPITRTDGVNERGAAQKWRTARHSMPPPSDTNINSSYILYVFNTVFKIIFGGA